MDIDNIEETDDPMEIDEPLPVTPIIERKSDGFQTNNNQNNISCSASNNDPAQNAVLEKDTGPGICDTPKSSKSSAPSEK